MISDRVAAVVVAAALVALFVIVVAQAAQLNGRRPVDEGRARFIESRCQFFEDGSAVCPPGVFATTTTVKP